MLPKYLYLRRMKRTFLLLLLLGLTVACKDTNKNPEAQNSDNSLASTEELPDLSIFHLPSQWTTQDAEEIELQQLRGKVLVAVMIYTECKAACPRLVADMRNIEKEFSEKELEKLQFLLISIDPEKDTPERLKEFAKVNEMDGKHWMFLRGTEDATREFAAVLAVNYKRISPIDFSHSNIISVFDEEGVLVHQQEGLGVSNQATLEAIQKELSE